MDVNNMNAAITARGFTPAGNNIYCGTYKDVPLWISPANNKKPTFTVGMAFLMTPSNLYLKAVQARLSEIATVKLAFRNDTYAVSLGSFMCKVQSKDVAADFGFLLDKAIEALVCEMPQANLEIPKVCSVCGQPGCDSFAYYKFYYRPVHANCIHTASQNAQNNMQKNQTGSYGKGLLGALLGAIVGSLPTILVLVFINIISGWLCALIPFAAYKGYTILGGKRTKLTVLFVILASVIIVPFVVYATTAIEYYQLFSEPISFSFFVYYLSSFGTGFLLQVLLFTGLGVLFSLRTIAQNNKGNLGIESSTIYTMRPISNNDISNTTAIPTVAGSPQNDEVNI